MANQGDGTREWAPRTVNLIRGCRHKCRYCYGCAMAVHYRGIDPQDWPNEVLVEKMARRTFRPCGDMVMYPSAHDITPEYLQQHIDFIAKLLRAYPKVLIVTKPHLECIRAICDAFAGERDRILFRFTIGSTSDDVLGFWEPGAPRYSERMACLELAYQRGFGTSVSCEPMLDDKVEDVVRAAQPYVTDTIWIGEANMLRHRASLNGYKDDETAAKVDQLLAWQSDDNILALYQRLKDNPQIRWKRSIQRVVGLEAPIAA